MKPETSALILIGYQNDYFADDGILHNAIEGPDIINNVLANTIDLIKTVAPTPMKVISTPIIFTPTYEELVDPVGILKIIKDSGAFKAGTRGGETIDEIKAFGERIIDVPGKRGLNAFSNTGLDAVLKDNGITDVIIAGAVTSICIDTTGRAALEYGYKVSILSDCTVGRTLFEQEFFCNEILPLYATVMTAKELMKKLGI